MKGGVERARSGVRFFGIGGRKASFAIKPHSRQFRKIEHPTPRLSACPQTSLRRATDLTPVSQRFHPFDGILTKKPAERSVKHSDKQPHWRHRPPTSEDYESCTNSSRFLVGLRVGWPPSVVVFAAKMQTAEGGHPTTQYVGPDESGHYERRDPNAAGVVVRPSNQIRRTEFDLSPPAGRSIVLSMKTQTQTLEDLRPELIETVRQLPVHQLLTVRDCLLELEIQRLAGEIDAEFDRADESGKISPESIEASIRAFRAMKPYE